MDKNLYLTIRNSKKQIKVKWQCDIRVYGKCEVWTWTGVKSIVKNSKKQNSTIKINLIRGNWGWS